MAPPGRDTCTCVTLRPASSDNPVCACVSSDVGGLNHAACLCRRLRGGPCEHCFGKVRILPFSLSCLRAAALTTGLCRFLPVRGLPEASVNSKRPFKRPLGAAFGPISGDEV